MDLTYHNTPNRYLETLSLQNACTFLNKRLFLIFFLTTDPVSSFLCDYVIAPQVEDYLHINQ